MFIVLSEFMFYEFIVYSYSLFETNVQNECSLVSYCFRFSFRYFNFSACSAPAIDIAFVMDGSGSIGTSNFDLSKSFVSNIIDDFEIGVMETRVGVIYYNQGQRTEIALGEVNDKMALKTAVMDIQ